MSEKSIKCLYDLEYDNQPYGLPIWYNNLIDKTIDQITIRDVFSMISNDILPELAIDKAIEFFIMDPFAGEAYAGQILELFVKNSEMFFKSKSSKLVEMLDKIKAMDNKEAQSKDQWGYDFDFDESSCNDYLQLLEEAKIIIKLK